MALTNAALAPESTARCNARFPDASGTEDPRGKTSMRLSTIAKEAFADTA
jgi:hypothetical protein